MTSVIETQDDCPGHVTLPFSRAPIPFDRPARRDPSPPSSAVPVPGEPRPTVVHLPEAVQQDIAGLGATLARLEPDPYDRLVAVHDWVATHVAYDVEAWRTRVFPPQDAETVFRTGTAVCAGYANLMVALGRAAGLEVVYVGGVSRDEGHAWNAARIDGHWVLLDVTWDAGHVGSAGFVADYSTEWLDVPPARFRASHHPRDPAWQLVDPPEDDAAFMARPRLGGGVVLLEPVTRAEEAVTLVLDAPGELAVGWRAASGEVLTACDVRAGTASCTVPPDVDVVIEIDQDGGFGGQVQVPRK